MYGSLTGYHGYFWDATQKSVSGNYYSFTVHSNYCDTPAFVKFLANGQQSYYHDLIPGLCPGGYASSLNWVNDSTIIAHAFSTIPGDSIHRWLKLDTLGNMKQVKDYPSWIDGTEHTATTFDNKFVSVAGVNDFWVYLYKLNSNLDYDSIYTHQYIYDSLCPGGVVSDTIDPNCDLIVGIDENNELTQPDQMKVNPNPASRSLTVEFPKYLKRTEKLKGITTSSSYYQWNYTTLAVFDLNGRKVLEAEVPKSMDELVIDVSGWSRGMYLFTLNWNHQVVSNKKVIIQ